MTNDTLTGITQRELLELAWRIVSEWVALSGAGTTAVLTTEAFDQTLRTFYDQVKERVRPLSEVVAGQAGVEPSPVVMIVDEGMGMTTVELLERLQRVTRDRQRFGDLVEALMPDDPIPPSAVLEQARQNAAARTAFLREFETVSSGDVADLYGSEAQNRAALAQSWRKQRRIFAVPTSAGFRFPLFQFQSDGEPKPQLVPILKELDEAGLRKWEVALWFAGALASIDGARPVDLLDEQPERVLDAAAQITAIPF